jgi:GTP cyclohydrolase I
MRHITWLEVQAEAERIAKTWRGRCDNVYGIPQGGAPLAVMVAYILGVPLAQEPKIGMNTLVVDDLVDSGKTLKRYFGKHHVDAAFRKSHSPTHYAPDATCIDDWLSFPWEKNDGAPTDGVVRLLEYIGENPERDGLRDTPERVLKAMKEMTVGYNTDIAQLLSVSFDVDFDELVVVRNVPFNSLCEHHMLPFTGTATVGYIPKKRIVGLSKLARLVDAYAKRLQVQERMTKQIADAMLEHIDPLGCGVVVRGNHSCMSCRGINKTGEMVTSSLHGVLRNDGIARAEFLALAGY